MTAELDASQAAIDRAWEMMSKLDYCMYVTRGAELTSRPMSTIVKRDEEAIYILTEAASATCDEIEQSADVLLDYSNGSNQFISCSAQATISTDIALVKALWNPGAQAFWPDGPETGKIAVLINRPNQARYWDGDSSIVSAVKFAFALATKTRPEMGEQKDVRL